MWWLKLEGKTVQRLRDVAWCWAEEVIAWLKAMSEGCFERSATIPRLDYYGCLLATGVHYNDTANWARRRLEACWFTKNANLDYSPLYYSWQWAYQERSIFDCPGLSWFDPGVTSVFSFIPSNTTLRNPYRYFRSVWWWPRLSIWDQFKSRNQSTQVSAVSTKDGNGSKWLCPSVIWFSRLDKRYVSSSPWRNQSLAKISGVKRIRFLYDFGQSYSTEEMFGKCRAFRTDTINFNGQEINLIHSLKALFSCQPCPR